MSARVSGEVWQHSKADGTPLLVLLAIADQAHDDGVTWLQVESREGKQSITSKARCHRATAFRAIEKLVEMAELQVVQVRRGESFINVYRVVVGRIADVKVDYDRLPFSLPHPFAPRSQIATVARVASGGVQGRNLHVPGSQSATSLLSIDLDPSRDPSEVQEEHPENWGKEDLLADVALTKIVEHVDRVIELGADRVQARESLPRSARLTPEVRAALLDRVDAARSETAVEAYRRWVEWKASDPQFELDEIATVVATWDDLDDVDRQDLLELADTTRAAALAQQEAAA